MAGTARSTQQPRVFLIGGAPRSGKGTVARRLATRLGYDLVATDDLGTAARAVTTPSTHSHLHPMAGVDYREYYLTRPSDVLWDEAVRAHGALWPAIEAVARAHGAWGTPAVIEGWALLPALVRGALLPNAAACWLVLDGPTLARRSRSDPDFYRGASDEEGMLQAFIERSLRYNEMVERAAERGEAVVVRVQGDEAVESLCDRVLTAAAVGAG